jgi:hypothetical protein
MECTPESVNCELCDQNYQNGAVSNQLTNGGRGKRECLGGDSESVDVYCRGRCTLLCKPNNPRVSLHKSATYGGQVLLYKFFRFKAKWSETATGNREQFRFLFEYSSEKNWHIFPFFSLLVRRQSFVSLLAKQKMLFFPFHSYSFSSSG